MCCSESKCINDCKVIQPLVITSLQCDLAFYRVVCSLFQNDNEIVPLAQMGFTRTPLLSRVGSSCSEAFEPFAWAEWSYSALSSAFFFPVSILCNKRQCDAFPSATGWGGRGLLHLGPHILNRMSEGICTLHSGKCALCGYILKIFDLQITGIIFSMLQNCFP